MSAGLFESRTVSLLNQEGQAFLEQWDPNNAVPIDVLFEGFRHRVSLRALVDACSREIKRTSIADNPKALRRAHLLFSVQAQLDEYEFRFDGAHKWRQEAATCLSLLNPKVMSLPQKNPSFFSGKTTQLKSAITLVDRERAYWGWNRQLLLNFILLLPETFPRRDAAESTLAFFAPWLGFLSYMTLSIHLTLELILMIKNSLLGPWLTRHKTQKIYFIEQLKTQLDSRKFGLLDDFLSIASNLIAFLWVTGEGSLGPFGPLLTASFRVLYVGLITWRNEEMKANYKRLIAGYEADIQALNAMSPKPEVEIKFLERELALCQRQFIFKQREFKTELYYLLGLFVGIALLCSLAFSPVVIPATLALVIGFLSYAISFGAVFQFHETRGKNAILLREEGKIAIDKDIQDTLKFFKETPDGRLKRQLYLDGQNLVKLYQQEDLLIADQKNILHYQTVLKAALPVIVLTAFLCLPASGAFAIMAVGMLLTTYMATYAPDYSLRANQQVNGFDETSYQSFIGAPDLTFGLMV